MFVHVFLLMVLGTGRYVGVDVNLETVRGKERERCYS